MGITDEYETEIREVPPDVVARVKKEFEAGEALLETATEETIGAKHIAWIRSFGGLIDQLDPHGEDFSGGSLRDQWASARWVNGNSPKDKFEHAVVFGQHVAIVRSILHGTVKVVTRKKEKVLRKSSPCVFHRRDLPPAEEFVFVLMPFGESWSDYIWSRQIKPIVEHLNGLSLQCRRADDLFGQDVMQDVYESVLTARLIIAEITGRNANVFYELGMAHSLGKDVVLLSQGEAHIPFDLKRFRHCIYSNDGPGYERLSQCLPGAIRSIIEGARA
jgi:hypothetical protein